MRKEEIKCSLPAENDFVHKKPVKKFIKMWKWINKIFKVIEYEVTGYKIMSILYVGDKNLENKIKSFIYHFISKI